ncbi:baculoviral IAP repeat-containing protein 2 [Penaeus vannamei nudivirus]|nr:baculoviral IAP repeat-containing protein 2 [Penaeus vannamei nucleopolyhedrovirus]
MDVIKKAIKMQLTKHRIMFTSLDDAIDQVTDIDIEPTIEEMANAEPEEEEQTTENELEEAENETNVEEVGNEEGPIEEMGNEEGPIFDNLLNRQIEYLQQIIIEEIDKEDKEKEELANKAENDKKELQLNECKICMDKYVSVIFLPCKHMIACTLCASALTECPVCRKRIGYAFSPIKM